jgi:hypothetical protein
MANKSIQMYQDPETGRTIVYGYSDEVSIKTHETLDEWREAKERKEATARDNRHYVNCYHDPITELNGKLAVNELGTIAKLLPYIKMNSGGNLFYDGKRMGIAEICKAIGKKSRWTIDIVKSLVESGVLIKERDGRRDVFNVNERYHTIGHTLNDRYYTKLYQTKTRTDIANISVQAAGVLYKALPFFHYDVYYLCANPNERNHDRIKHLTQAHFAEIAGIEPMLAHRSMNELSRHGFVMIIKAYGGTNILVNPDVMFRKKDTYDEFTDSVRCQFKQAKANVEQNGVDIEQLPY